MKIEKPDSSEKASFHEGPAGRLPHSADIAFGRCLTRPTEEILALGTRQTRPARIGNGMEAVEGERLSK